MKLDEIKRNKPPEPTMDINHRPTTREEVTTWIAEHIGLVKHWITPDLEVDFLDDQIIHLGGKKIKGSLPIKIRKMKGELVISYNQLTSFENFPEECKSITANNNRFTSLVGIDRIKKITGSANKCQFDLVFNKIKEGGIGLLLIENLTYFNCNVVADSGLPNGKNWITPKPFEIIKKYLGRPDEIFDCQVELIDAGYEAFAKL